MSYRAEPVLNLTEAAPRAPMQARLMTSDEYRRVVASIQPQVEAGA